MSERINVSVKKLAKDRTYGVTKVATANAGPEPDVLSKQSIKYLYFAK